MNSDNDDDDDCQFIGSMMRPPNLSPTARKRRRIGQHEHEAALASEELFRLTPNTGLPCGTSLPEILRMGKLTSAVVFSYQFEVEWLMSQFPVQTPSCPVLLIHGFQPNSPGFQKLMSASKGFHNVRTFRAPGIDAFGTHHSKILLLFYDSGMRIVITTANMKQSQWEYKTQGVWISSLFPRLEESIAKADSDVELPLPTGRTRFAHDFLVYLRTYCGRNDDPMGQTWLKVVAHNIEVDEGVRFVASVPGKHTGHVKNRWGHLALRKHLCDVPQTYLNTDDDVVAQFTSIGSMGGIENTKWATSLKRSLLAGQQTTWQSRPSMKVVFPTVENVRTSSEGYLAGTSIPNSAKTAAKQTFLQIIAHQWICKWSGRSRAAPHIKTYARWNRNGKLSWCLLTSANLSKAAWGDEQLGDTQLFIRNYEAGVLFLPTGNSSLTAMQYHDIGAAEKTRLCPLPYDYPLVPYKADDKWWVWDRPYSKIDSLGNMYDGF